MIIVNNYLQKDIISSKRWRVLSKELAHQGHMVTVLCGVDPCYNGEMLSINKLENDNLRIVQIDTTNFFFLFRNKARIIAKVEQHGESLDASQNGTKQISLVRFCKFLIGKSLRELICINELKCSEFFKSFVSNEYDAIISSIFYENAFYMGRYLYKISKKSAFVCEIRDPLTHQIVPCKERDAVYSGFAKRIVTSTDAVFFVGDGVKKSFEKELRHANKFSDKLFVFPHTYSLDDDRLSGTENFEFDVPPDLLHIVFTGTIYDCYLNAEFRLLFSCVSALIKQGIIQKNDILFSFAGIDTIKIHALADALNLNDCIAYYDLLPKGQALALQKSGDILLYIGKEVTGKFPEYILSGKTILSIFGSETADCPISTAMGELNIGKCYNTNCQFSTSELKKFINESVLQKKQFGALPSESNKDAAQRYSVETVAKNMIDVLQLLMPTDRKE